jgi:predicted phosphoadenosine phosphosulfate sulfurtransferase
MSRLKRYREENVLSAAQARVRYAFDNFTKVYVSFSGGKDSSVMLHLVMDEAIKRGRRVGVLVIDLEAQYTATIKHVEEMLNMYADHIDAHWVCLPLVLRNAVSNYSPRWCCWDPSIPDQWVRQFPDHPAVIKDPAHYPFFAEHMEFEEFIVDWAEWYSQGEMTCGMIGIRCDESLNRFRTIAARFKDMHNGTRYTTHVVGSAYNLYPIYDWKTEDIWRYHAHYPEKPHNTVYDRMYQAGLTLSQMRLCQPYGDDQRRGLWLYHVLEPQTWFKLVVRVNGANSGSASVQESGNISGYGKITKPDGHTWESFCKLLLSSLPDPTRVHYQNRFKTFLSWWRARGYKSGIPDEAPRILEEAREAPSWRRLCKALLRNDWWCKGLGFSQPVSEAYSKFKRMKRSGIYST